MPTKNYTARPQLTTAERKKLDYFSDITAQLLFHRAIPDNQTAQIFLNPDYELHTHDPFLLKDAKRAAERIIKAIENKEKIVIYGDYDADGIPAGVVMHDFFKKIGFTNFINYIPHRHDEGFGLNVDAVEQFADKKAKIGFEKSGPVKLLITLDCGITDIAAVTLAKEKGIDVIITDHHEPPKIKGADGVADVELLPPAYAVIDHKQAGCTYPEQILCGSGVTFKLIQAILALNRFGLKEGQEKWWLDMVGIATLSDMVPLTGENRVFAYYGLAVLRKSPRKGLVRLLSQLKINQRYLSEDDIAFMITPRINAASRMGVPMDAFRLLATDDDDEAHHFAEHLDSINNERKGTVAALVKEIKKTLADRTGEMPPVIVAGNPQWRPSLLGLVASSLADEYGRTAFLWGRDGDDVIKGSCRSGKGGGNGGNGPTSVVEIMRQVPAGIFIQYGGHAASGGFAVENDAIHHLEQHLNTAYRTLVKDGEEKVAEKNYVDVELDLGQINWQTYRDIEGLAPFGVGNPKPLFMLKQVRIGGMKAFGKTKNHLELSLTKLDGKVSGGAPVVAIGFFMTLDTFKNKDGKPLSVGDTIDLVATMEKSNFRGRPELRLRIVDVV